LGNRPLKSGAYPVSDKVKGLTMATFSITGLDVISSATGQITTAKVATLQIVSALGDATLDYSYIADHQGSAEVTLSNYNLLLNSMHLNDGPLPDRIEMFNMRWDQPVRCCWKWTAEFWVRLCPRHVYGTCPIQSVDGWQYPAPSRSDPGCFNRRRN